MRRTASFDVLSVKIHAGVSAVGEWKNQNKVVNMRIGNIWVYISPIWWEETPQRIDPNFFLAGGIHDIITHARFGDDSLRGSWVVWGVKFQHFPLTLLVVLTALTLTCERDSE